MGERGRGVFGSPTMLVIMTMLWVAGLGAGGYFVWRYATTPGRVGTHPRQWPNDSALARTDGAPTLLVFLHPHCSCSRATLAELAELQGRAGRVRALVVLVAPPGASRDFTQSALADAASRIPGVTVVDDRDAVEATRFDALTSGVTLLYATNGELVFGGGITGTRGHAGDNAGLRALRAQLDAPTGVRHSSIFGCAIFDEHEHEHALGSGGS